MCSLPRRGCPTSVFKCCSLCGSKTHEGGAGQSYLYYTRLASIAYNYYLVQIYSCTIMYCVCIIIPAIVSYSSGTNSAPSMRQAARGLLGLHWNPSGRSEYRFLPRTAVRSPNAVVDDEELHRQYLNGLQQPPEVPWQSSPSDPAFIRSVVALAPGGHQQR